MRGSVTTAAATLALWLMGVAADVDQSTLITSDTSVSLAEALPTTTMLIMCAQDANEWQGYASGVGEWGQFDPEVEVPPTPLPPEAIDPYGDGTPTAGYTRAPTPAPLPPAWPANPARSSSPPPISAPGRRLLSPAGMAPPPPHAHNATHNATHNTSHTTAPPAEEAAGYTGATSHQLGVCINATRQLFADLYLVVKTPGDFTQDARGGANRAAVCLPRNAGQDMSCKDIIRGEFSRWYGSIGAKGAFEGDGTACEGKPEIVMVGKSGIGVAGLLLDFVCLTSETSIPCGPAIIKAINDGQLQDTVTHGTPPAAVPTACVALSDAGCCSGAFVNLLRVYMQLMCVTPSSKILNVFRSLLAPCSQLKPPKLWNPTCAGFLPDQYSSLAPDVCPTDNLYNVAPQYDADDWQTHTGIGNLENVVKQCAEERTDTCPGDLCSFGCFASRSMVEIFTSLFETGDSPPGMGGMNASSASGEYTYDATLSAGLNLGVARTMLVLGALGGVCGAATLVVRRLLRGGATAYQRVDAGVVA